MTQKIALPNCCPGGLKHREALICFEISLRIETQNLKILSFELKFFV